MTRIIAGRARGHRLVAPKGDATRPTTDRVREALFSSLATWFGTADEGADAQLAGLRVLDLFAGTGAVGLEAASRGAERVTLVDNRTASTIRDNASRAGLSVDIRGTTAAAAVESLTGPLDLVFLDPPYPVTNEAVETLLTALAVEGRLAPQALVVVERSARGDAFVWPEGYVDTWDRGYGETVLRYGATAEEGSS